MNHATRAVLGLILLAGLGQVGCLPIELSVSKDGQVLIPRQEGFCCLDPEKGAVKTLYAPKSQQPAFALFAPDGRSFLAITQTEGGGMGTAFALAVVPPDGQEAKQLFTATNLTYARWSPSGRHVTLTRIADEKAPAVDENLPELILVDPAKGTRKTLISGVSTIHRWFPDSKHVLTFQISGKEKEGAQNTQYSGKLVQLDAETGDVKPLALVLGGKMVFFDLSPDGTKVLFTAIKAAKLGEKIPTRSEDEPRLYELNIADGGVRALKGGVAFAIYSPKGTKVLVGSKSEQEGMLQLAVGDAALAQAETVATDAAKSTGGTDSREIYPSWLDDDTILYLRLYAAYGTAGRNLQLFAVSADGKKRRNLQPAVDGAVKE